MTLLGHFDGIHENHIVGWALHQELLDSSVEITICVNNAPIATLHADLLRNDLAKQGVGTGRYGFRFPLPEHFIGEPDLTVEIAFTATGTALSNGGQFFTRTPEGGYVKTGNTVKGCFGRLTMIERHVIHGWAYDRRERRAPELEMRIDGRKILTFTPELEPQPGKAPEGVLSFAQPIPVHFRDNQTHQIEILFAGSERQLDYSPVAAHIRPGPDAPPGDIAALVGKEGFLYLCRDRNHSLESLTGEHRFTAEGLGTYVELLAKRQQMLAAQGIPYIFAVSPSKESIYPEHLPDEVKPAADGSLFDQLQQALLATGQEPLLDLRPAMQDGKPRSPYLLYRKNDSHWSEFGGYFAYLAIMEAIGRHFPGMTPYQLSDFSFATEWRYDGDLLEREQVRYVGGGQYEALPARVIPEADCYPLLKPKQPTEFTPVAFPPLLKPKDHRPTFVYENPEAKGPRVLFLMSSSAGAFQRYFPEHFRRIAYIWDALLDPEILAHEKPDLVLQLLPERYLPRIPER